MASAGLKQLLGPSGEADFIVLVQEPLIVSNGQWILTDKAAKKTLPKMTELWRKNVLKTAEQGQISLVDLNPVVVGQFATEVAKGKRPCIYCKGANLFTATFDPGEQQVTLAYRSFLEFERTSILLRRPLHHSTGAYLTKDGEPMAYSWSFMHPTSHTIWIWAPYVSLMARVGAVAFEYNPENKRVVIMKNKYDHTVGMVGLYDLDPDKESL